MIFIRVSSSWNSYLLLWKCTLTVFFFKLLLFLSQLLSLTLSRHYYKHQTRQSNAEALNYCQPICTICCISVCWWKGWWGTWWPWCKNICRGGKEQQRGFVNEALRLDRNCDLQRLQSKQNWCFSVCLFRESQLYMLQLPSQKWEKSWLLLLISYRSEAGPLLLQKITTKQRRK